MFRLLFLILVFSTYSAAQAQDFIAVKKKNGITIKSFTTGSPIIFQLHNGRITEGFIRQIRNDSLWIMRFNVQIVPTRLNVTMVDTTSAYLEKLHYLDIARIYLGKKSKRIPMLASKVLMAGGAGYIALNSINHLLDGDTELFIQKENYQRLIIAGIVAASGFILSQLFKKIEFSHRRHKITYINLQ
jgi:hypothetical protein